MGTTRSVHSKSAQNKNTRLHVAVAHEDGGSRRGVTAAGAAMHKGTDASSTASSQASSTIPAPSRTTRGAASATAEAWRLKVGDRENT